jgi:hypothetical protein
LSLAQYLRSHLPENKRRALVLTTQGDRPEGRCAEHPDYEAFVVNVSRYRDVAKNDAAGAYFAGLQGILIAHADDAVARGFSRDEFSRLLDALGTGETIAGWIGRHPEEIASIGEIWNGLLARCAPTASLADELRSRFRNMSIDDVQGVTDLIVALDFPANVLRAASLSRRKKAVEEFRAHLQDGTWCEKQWQAFFEREHWIFGHGLLYQFTHLIQREALVGGKTLANWEGQYSDYLVRTMSNSLSCTALVEIKTPTALLVNAEPYRNGAHAIHPDLAGAIAQVQANCDVWTREGSGQNDNIRQAEQERWITALPRGIVVVGETSSLNCENAKQSFELFRRHLHGLEILTFDELLVRAEAIAS